MERRTREQLTRENNERNHDHMSRVDKLLHEQNPIHIAETSLVYRYHANKGNGAYKYDPVQVTSIPFKALSKLQEIRTRRWNPSEKITTQPIIKPLCHDRLMHKVMMVPSIGCPAELKNIDMIQQLLWVRSADYRPTFLLVHECEILTYEEEIGKILKEVGVGLVSWKCGDRVGFGLSRLAAQQFAATFNELRLRVVLCDVNVTVGAFQPRKKRPVLNKSLKDGYDTDVQDDSDVEGKSGFELNKGRKRKLLYAAGKGAGTTSAEYGDSDDEYDIRKKIKNATFGPGRPIEQVAIVRPELQYDPCFITSSEDSDIQDCFLDHINATSKDIAQFKRNAFINKVEFKTENVLSEKYVAMRDEYLNNHLKAEDDYFIEYTYNDTDKITKIIKVGELAKAIAEQHGKKQWDVRSMIIDKILLRHKRGI